MRSTTDRQWWGKAVWWLPGMLVALCAAAATSRGLYDVVATGAHTPPVIAVLYPIITDGLALTAYAATTRLHGAGRAYAWTVVVLAAGLSGTAQAAYLAGGTAAASTGLRIVIGAWPALAAAIAAHLLFLMIHTTRTATATEHRPDDAPAPAAFNPTPGPASTVQPSGVQSAVQLSDRTPVQPDAEHPSAAVQWLGAAPASDQTPAPHPGGAERRPHHAAPPVHPDRTPTTRTVDPPARTRATDAAQRYLTDHGALPTVSQLQALADVSRGTAGEVLKHLREHPSHLHLIQTDDTTDTTQAQR